MSWNSLITCWMYTIILGWLRVYSADNLSCLKSWELCSQHHYFNTFSCWTGKLKKCIKKLQIPNIKDTVFHTTGKADKACHKLHRNFSKSYKGYGEDKIYFYYGCVSVAEFCELHGWTAIETEKRMCWDPATKTKHSIYERRNHAAFEYF